MEPNPIFAELTEGPAGAHDGHRRGARTVTDLMRVVEGDRAGAPASALAEPHVGRVPGVLSFRLPA